MKKALTILIASILVFSLASCYEHTVIHVNAENQETLSGGIFGKDALTEIGNGLYYDVTTRIVYWWNGTLQRGSSMSTTPTPYYAPNGLPYRYNSETSTFEEIERR